MTATEVRIVYFTGVWSEPKDFSSVKTLVFVPMLPDGSLIISNRNLCQYLTTLGQADP
jgi:hypothetical protein